MTEPFSALSSAYARKRSTSSDTFSLTRAHVSDTVFPKPKKLYLLRAQQDTIEDAIRILTDHKIRAVPVVDAQGNYVGCLTHVEIMAFLLDKFPKENELFDDYFRKVTFAGFELMSKCGDVVRHSQARQGAPVVSSSLDMSVLFAIRLLNSKTLQRIPVLDESGTKPVGILSQFDLIRFLQKHKTHLPSAHKTLVDLGLADKDEHLVAASENDLVICAIKKMIDNNLSGIPVLDAQGRVKHHFSVSDVKVTVNNYAWLTMPIASAHAHTSLVIGVYPESKLSQALDLIVEHHIHSIYVLSKEKRVLRLLALSDFLNLFAGQDFPSPAQSRESHSPLSPTKME